MFAIQCKLRKCLPLWLFAWLDGIRGTAKHTNRVGILILKTPRMPDRDALVVLRYSDFVDLHGPQPFEASPERIAEREHKKLRRRQAKAEPTSVTSEETTC